MRFEQEHDPDPLRDKYRAFDGISNLPADIQKLVDVSYTKIERSIDEYEKKNPDKIGPQAYMAIQDVQITALQREIKNILKSLLDIATKLDSASDGDS
jgi:phage-related protein